MGAYIQLEDLFRFIQPEELSVYCGFSPNIRVENILPHIQKAQDLKIKIALGNTLYDELKTEFINANYNPNLLPDGTTLPNQINYKELYTYIFKPLIFWTAFYAIDDIAIKIEEKGLMINSSDYSEAAALEHKKIKEDRTRKTAEEYTELLYTYLQNTFKENEVFEEESKDEGRRFSGMHFPKKVKNGNHYKPF